MTAAEHILDYLEEALMELEENNIGDRLLDRLSAISSLTDKVPDDERPALVNDIILALRARPVAYGKGYLAIRAAFWSISPCLEV
jgi:hypothetical protein